MSSFIKKSIANGMWDSDQVSSLCGLPVFFFENHAEWTSVHCQCFGCTSSSIVSPARLCFQPFGFQPLTDSCPELTKTPLQTITKCSDTDKGKLPSGRSPWITGLLRLVMSPKQTFGAAVGQQLAVMVSVSSRCRSQVACCIVQRQEIN